MVWEKKTSEQRTAHMTLKFLNITNFHFLTLPTHGYSFYLRLRNPPGLGSFFIWPCSHSASHIFKWGLRLVWHRGRSSSFSTFSHIFPFNAHSQCIWTSFLAAFWVWTWKAQCYPCSQACSQLSHVTRRNHAHNNLLTLFHRSKFSPRCLRDMGSWWPIKQS